MLRQLGHAVSILLVPLVLTGCGAGTRTEPAASPTPSPQASVPAELKGDYLGQQLPGPSPEPFAPDIVEGELHTPPVFTPDGAEAYWSVQDPAIVSAKVVNGAWTKPAAVTFSESMTDYRDPFVSPSGDRLFFLSKEGLPGSKLPEKENIWFVERSGQGWGAPQPVSEKVNALNLHWQISVAKNGNLYFSSGGQEPIGDIYVSRLTDGEYSTPKRLAAPVSTDQIELTPYIAPDESYLIFARMADENSNPLLYVSYADGNGGWGEPVQVSNVGYGLAPVVSPDGKYMFFLSSPQSVSWMNTEFLTELRPAK